MLKALLCDLDNDLSAGMIFRFTMSVLYLIKREDFRDGNLEFASRDFIGQLVEA